MANSPTDSTHIDRLSNLPDELLVVILSFLPTHIAARTSVLSRRFRHLWEASPSLELIGRDLPHPQYENFLAMANRALLRRNPSDPLLSLRLQVSGCGRNAIKMVLYLLAKVRSLDLRRLILIDFWCFHFLRILPIIFTINSLRCLSVDLRALTFYQPEELKFPSGINLTCLRSLSLKLMGIHLTGLNTLLSELCSLEDLLVDISETPGLSISNLTIRKLKLIITNRTEKHVIVGLSLPSLESLHLEIRYSLGNMSHFDAQLPLLRKAGINLHGIRERNVSAVAGLLNCISHVEDLHLHLEGVEKYPIPILLESGKDVPKFSNLKHLDLTLCFHEQNFEAVTMMLHNCPVLKSLKLVHKSPYLVRGQKKKDWRSKLPRNADYAYFRNLHLGEDRKRFMKLLRKKCTSKTVL